MRKKSIQNELPVAAPLTLDSIGTDPSTIDGGQEAAAGAKRNVTRPTAGEMSGKRKDAVSSYPLIKIKTNDDYEREQTTLRLQLEQELRDLTIPELIEQLRSVRTTKEMPKTVYIHRNANDEEERSIISSLTIPDEITRSMNQDSSMPITSPWSDPRKSSASARKHPSKPRDLVSIRRFPPLPPPKELSKDSSRAQGISLSIQLHDRPVHGLYSGRVDSEGRPSGIGVLKFDNNDMYIGEFQEGMLHGRGTYLFDNETSGDSILRGEFENNKFVI